MHGRWSRVMALAAAPVAAPAAAQESPAADPLLELVRIEVQALNRDVAAALEQVAAARADDEPDAAPVPAERLVVAVPFRSGDVRISAESRARLLGAAAAMQELGTGTLRVVGFTDRTGPPAANARIAERRAAVVAELLTEAGYPADSIEIVSAVAAGWELPVPTEEGVNEPRNRVAHVYALD